MKEVDNKKRKISGKFPFSFLFKFRNFNCIQRYLRITSFEQKKKT